MGHRGGMFHDPLARTIGKRRWASRRWLCCSLTYPGRHRHPVWSRGYTQLFFLDEVTALAAGHRPCAECRRSEATAFREAVATGSREDVPSLAALDERLHAERLDQTRPLRRAMVAGSLPDGAMFAADGHALAVRMGSALAWSHEGYGAPTPLPRGRVEVLTPPATLSALRAGYPPLWHPTAR